MEHCTRKMCFITKSFCSHHLILNLVQYPIQQTSLSVSNKVTTPTTKPISFLPHHHYSFFNFIFLKHHSWLLFFFSSTTSHLLPFQHHTPPPPSHQPHLSHSFPKPNPHQPSNALPPQT